MITLSLIHSSFAFVAQTKLKCKLYGGMSFKGWTTETCNVLNMLSLVDVIDVTMSILLCSRALSWKLSLWSTLRARNSMIASSNCQLCFTGAFKTLIFDADSPSTSSQRALAALGLLAWLIIIIMSTCNNEGFVSVLLFQLTINFASLLVFRVPHKFYKSLRLK